MAATRESRQDDRESSARVHRTHRRLLARCQQSGARPVRRGLPPYVFPTQGDFYAGYGSTQVPVIFDAIHHQYRTESAADADLYMAFVRLHEPPFVRPPSSFTQLLPGWLLRWLRLDPPSTPQVDSRRSVERRLCLDVLTSRACGRHTGRRRWSPGGPRCGTPCSRRR